MFSLKDICDVAIQIEENGEKTYRSAQAKVDDIRLKELLGWMADEEARHANWFANLSKRLSISVQHPQIEEMGKNLLKESIGDQTFNLSEDALSQEASLRHVFEQSIEFEKDTIIFYEMLKAFIDDKVVMEQLEIIIQEERNHVDTLVQFADKASLKAD